MDDCQALTESLIHHFLKDFLERLPENVHLMMASRISPEFLSPRLLIDEEIIQLGITELRFNRQEVEDYLTRNGLSAVTDVVEHFMEKTDGWPAALKMAGKFTAETTNLDQRRTTQEIYNYLASEVLKNQPEEIKAFLTATSILEVVTPQYCNLLLKRSDSGKWLEYLVQQQLFIYSLAGTKQAYRYHQLFQDFLQGLLGEKKSELLYRAGLIARQLNDLDRAMEYFAAAGSETEIVATIQTACENALLQGRWQTVSRWLDYLSPDQLIENPWLALYRAQIEVYRGRLDEADYWAQKTTTIFNSAEDMAGLTESLILKAKIMRRRGKYQESLELLDQVESAITGESMARIDLPLEKSILFYMTGAVKEAEQLLLKALNRVERLNDGYLSAHLLEGLGNIHYVKGNYQKALQFYKKGATISPDRVLPGYYSQDFIATIYQDWGESEQAFEYAKRNVAIKENLGLIESLPSAYIQLAGIYVDRGEFDQAEKYYRRAVDLGRDNNSESFYLALNLVFWARCLCLQNRLIEAKLKLEEALVEAGSEPSLALAVCRAVGSMVLYRFGHTVEAEKLLLQGIKDLERMGFQKGLCGAYEIIAALYFNSGNTPSAIKYAGKALELASKLNDLQTFITLYDLLHPILHYGLENGVEESFICRVLTRLGSRCLKILTELAAHSDPAVRLRVLVPLAEIGGKQAEKIICQLIDDNDPMVSDMAESLAVRAGVKFVTLKNPFPERNVHLQLKCLGPLRIILDNQDITTINWRTAKARDLLIYLAHIKESVTKDRILTDLWPDEEPGKSSHLFHMTIYRLRQVFNKYCATDLVVYGGGRYRLLPDTVDADWRIFEQLIASGNGKADPAKQAEQLDKALLLYRGHYLEDMDYSWILPWQEHFKNLCIEARFTLAKHYIQNKEFQSAIIHLKSLLEIDNLMEEAHGLIMSAYAGLGDCLAVNKHYQDLTALFRGELGLAPSAETTALYRKLCN